MHYSNIRYALCCTPVYRNAISVVYLVLTILQINLSSSLSIIGFVTEVKQVLVGHRTQNCHLSDVVIFNVYISYKTVGRCSFNQNLLEYTFWIININKPYGAIDNSRNGEFTLFLQ